MRTEQREKSLAYRKPVANWNELTEDVMAPAPVIAAMTTGRPELLNLAHGCTPEVMNLYQVIRVLLETNRALQEHSQELASQMGQLKGQLTGLLRKFYELENFANFAPALPPEENE